MMLYEAYETNGDDDGGGPGAHVRLAIVQVPDDAVKQQWIQDYPDLPVEEAILALKQQRGAQ